MTDKSLRQRAIDLYKPPFRYDQRGGYIWDAENQMVADNHTDPKDDAALRVRGWGRIGYLDDPEALQDEVGAVLAEALTAYWAGHQPSPHVGRMKAALQAVDGYLSQSPINQISSGSVLHAMVSEALVAGPARASIPVPLSTTGPDGQTWQLFTYDFMTQDGLFSGYIHALDMGHAEQLMDELRSSAVLVGQVVEVLD